LSRISAMSCICALFASCKSITSFCSKLSHCWNDGVALD
jgi:hypothetical protein